MPVVQHHVTRPDGAPATLLDVAIDLITGDQRPVAFRKSTKTGISTHVDLTPDGAGWTSNLVDSDGIAPDGSVYRVTEHLEDAPRAVWYFRVPTGPGPFELTDLLTTAPEGLPPAVVVSDPTVVEAHNNDPDAHPDIRALIGAGPGSVTRLLGAPITAIAVGGHRVVTPGADGRIAYASNTTLAHLHAPLWVTLNAAPQGAQVAVLKAGDTTESTWSWTAGSPVFLGADGYLTQTPPTIAAGAVFSARIGVATSPTALTVERQPSILLDPTATPGPSPTALFGLGPFGVAPFGGTP